METKAKAWVKNKENQRFVIKKLFNEYPPLKNKLAFFMAGIPGSGKTEFAQNTINSVSQKLVPIEHDRLVEYIDEYDPGNYYAFRKAGNDLVGCIFDECIKNGYSFIFDGTLSHQKGSHNISKALSEGYFVFVVYIIQDAEKAWALTQDRELVIKRAIERSGFEETCRKININLLDIFNKFKSNRQFGFWIFNKNGREKIDEATSIIYSTGNIGSEEEIVAALKTSYNLRKETL